MKLLCTYRTGYRTWTMIAAETAEEYNDLAHTLKSSETGDDADTEYGCTLSRKDLVLINVPGHQSMAHLLHTILHEVKHTVIYAMGGCDEEEHHNEKKIDGEAAVWTDILTSLEWINGQVEQPKILRRRRNSRTRKRASVVRKGHTRSVVDGHDRKRRRVHRGAGVRR